MANIMDNGFPLSVETVLLFFGILFIAFCCGFLRSLKKYFGTRIIHDLNFETVLLYFGILSIVFCCGCLRSLKKYLVRRTRHPNHRHRNILVTHIRIPTSVQLQNETNVGNVFPGDEQINPPPYSAVSNILPPSYDEAIKQNAASNEHENEAPKADARF